MSKSVSVGVPALQSLLLVADVHHQAAAEANPVNELQGFIRRIMTLEHYTSRYSGSLPVCFRSEIIFTSSLCVLLAPLPLRV